MKIAPLGDRVLVRLDTAEVSRGGIFLPGATLITVGRGVVESVGPGRLAPSVTYIEPADLTEDLVHFALRHREELSKGDRLPMEVKPGDRILFPQAAGTPLEVDTPEESTPEEPAAVPSAQELPVEEPAPRPLRRTKRERFVLLRHDDIMAVLSGEGEIHQRIPEPGEPLPGT